MSKSTTFNGNWFKSAKNIENGFTSFDIAGKECKNVFNNIRAEFFFIIYYVFTL